MTDREIARALRRAELHRVRPGAFITAMDLAEVERTRRRTGLLALAVAAAVRPARATLGHDTAAWVWGLPLPARPRGMTEPVHLIDPIRRGVGPDWVLHRATLPPLESTQRGAYRLTSAARTVVDVARRWREVDAVAAADAALLRALTTPEELAEVLGRHMTVAGTPQVRRVLDLADGRAESWLETYGRLAFAAAGLPPFVPQVELWLGDELLKVADGWYPEAALAIEFDGRTKYAGPEEAARRRVWAEKEVEDLLRSEGVRFVAADVRAAHPGMVPAAWVDPPRAGHARTAGARIRGSTAGAGPRAGRPTGRGRLALERPGPGGRSGGLSGLAGARHPAPGTRNPPPGTRHPAPGTRRV